MFDNIYVLCVAAVGAAAAVIAFIWMLILKPSAPVNSRPARFCPLCKSELGEKETLKGLIVDTNPPQKILIRGCTRCAPKTEQGEW